MIAVLLYHEVNAVERSMKSNKNTILQQPQ